jgi:hypothetical protein
MRASSRAIATDPHDVVRMLILRRGIARTPLPL